MTLFATVDPRPIHFMGIAGAGMSGLALLAGQQGVAITGCDNDPSGAADLAAAGVEIWRGHDPGHVIGARAVVVTAAVAGDHPELERARALGIPVIRRADALAQLVAGGVVVAVAGTHGKTTTTVMVTEALAAAGRNPTGLAGGRVAGWGGNARLGGRAGRAAGGGRATATRVAGRSRVRRGCADRRSTARGRRLAGAHRAAGRGGPGGTPAVAGARAAQPPERRGGARGGARARRGSGALRRRAGGVHRRGAAFRASR